MKRTTEGQGGPGRYGLLVGLILLMSMMLVGTTVTGTGYAPESREMADGVNITVNATFGADPTISLEEEGDAYVMNMSGVMGMFVENNVSRTYTYVADPAGVNGSDWSDDNVTIAIADGAVTFTPTDVLTANGITMVRFQGSSNETDMAYVDVTINVAAMNDYPEIDDVEDFDATQGVMVAVQVNGSDEETAWTDFDVEVAFAEDWEDAPEAMPDSIMVVEDDDGLWWLKVNATNDDAAMGMYYLNVSLTDEGDLFEALLNVTVTILNANDAPALPATWPAVEVTEEVTSYIHVGPITDPDLAVPGAAEVFDIDAYWAFKDEGELYPWMPLTAGVIYVDEVPWANITYTPDDFDVAIDSMGMYDGTGIFLEVEDAGMLSANLSFDLTIVNVNDVPWIMAANEVNATYVQEYTVAQDANLTVGFWAFDNDTAAGLTWDLTVAALPPNRAAEFVYPETALFTNVTAAMWSHEFDEYRIDDGYMDTELAGFENATFIEIDLRPTNDDVGEINFTLKANDGVMDVEYNFTVTVTNVNDAPTAPTLVAPEGLEGEGTMEAPYAIENESLMVEFTATAATDIDTAVDATEVLTYAVDWGEGTRAAEAVVPDENGTLAFGHTYTAEGIYLVNFTCKDKGGIETFDSFYINVSQGIVHVPSTVDMWKFDTPVGDVEPGDAVAISGNFTDDGLGEGFSIIVEVLDATGAVVDTFPATLNADGTFTVNFNWPMNGTKVNVKGMDGTTEVTPTAGPTAEETPTFLAEEKASKKKDKDDEDPTMMYLIVVLLIVVIAVVAVVMMKKAKKKKEEEEARKKAEEEAAAAIGPAMERAASLQQLAVASQLDVAPMQAQFDEAGTKQGEGDNIGAVEVITGYNSQIEQALQAQGVDVEAQLAAMAAQAEGGEMPPEQQQLGPDGMPLAPDQQLTDGQMPPDQMAADPAAAAAPDQAAAAAPDQAAADPAAAAQQAPCPFCQNPLAVGQTPCPSCGNGIQWG